MTREEKILMAIEKGYIYSPKTGQIISKNGVVVKNKHTKGYLRIDFTTNKKRYVLLAHQFAWYWVHKETLEMIDHINEIKTDNRINNLRPSNSIKNQQNISKRKGYYWSKTDNAFKGQIIVNRKKIYLGLFKDEKSANIAYLKAKEKYFIL